MNAKRTVSSTARRLAWLAATAVAASIVVAAGAVAAGGSGSTPSSNDSTVDEAYAVAVQPNGKVIVAGWSEEGGRGAGEFALVRYASTGRRDRAFGAGGKVFAGASSFEEAHAVAVQADGKIVAAGEGGEGLGFLLARFLPNGRLDPSFGSGGRVDSTFDEACGGWARALAIQGDGRLVVAGMCSGDDNFFVLARYMPDGRLDGGFGNGGIVHTDFGSPESFEAARAVAIQDDGKIVAAGESDAANPQDDVAIARYTSDGRLDPSFGVGGRVLTDLGGTDGASAVLVQTDGKIFIGGGHGLARYNTDGSLDTTFGRGGILISDASIGGAALRPDGKIVAAGGSASGRIVVARYLPEGRLDPGFGPGRGTTWITFGDSYSWGGAVALGADGKIVAAGTSERSFGDSDFALARFNEGGAVDRRFGSAGKVRTDFGDVVTTLTATRTRPVAVQWRTDCESNTSGFHVYRATGGRRLRLNPKLIASKGSATAGASYSFTSRQASRPADRYWLQEVKRSGERAWYGPVAKR